MIFKEFFKRLLNKCKHVVSILPRISDVYRARVITIVVTVATGNQSDEITANNLYAPAYLSY